MTIVEIYDKFGIPPNLRQHMLRVAGFVRLISDSWKTTNLDSSGLMKAALLHDVGNLVKFDFVKHPEFLGDGQKRIEYWKVKQREFIDLFGGDDHLATEKILEELKVEKRVTELVAGKSFGKAETIRSGNDWELKILLYADMRISPSGLTNLETRLNDVVTRIEKYRNDPKKEKLVEACRDIEKEIQERIMINLEIISVEDIQNSEENLILTVV